MTKTTNQDKYFNNPFKDVLSKVVVKRAHEIAAETAAQTYDEGVTLPIVIVDEEFKAPERGSKEWLDNRDWYFNKYNPDGDES